MMSGAGRQLQSYEIRKLYVFDSQKLQLDAELQNKLIFFIKNKNCRFWKYPLFFSTILQVSLKLYDVLWDSKNKPSPILVPIESTKWCQTGQKLITILSNASEVNIDSALAASRLCTIS